MSYLCIRFQNYASQNFESALLVLSEEFLLILPAEIEHQTTNI